nr:diaminobutyrate acetyltransferase [Litorivivens lipolytica]
MSFRVPQATDGAALHQLVANCPPLDPNSLYCNLLQCSHFADTAVAVEYEGELVGFISGYIPPNKPDTLFVWQVAVDSSMRGQGLGGRMLGELVDRTGVKWMETTVTPDNGASWGMFRSFARKRNAECEDCGPLFERDAHFGGQHDSEHLARLGPFK